MINEYIAVNNMRDRQNEFLREAEQDRLAQEGADTQTPELDAFKAKLAAVLQALDRFPWIFERSR